MRENRNPWMQPERMTRRQRLNTEDVQHRVAELARCQCREQISFYQVSTTPQTASFSIPVVAGVKGRRFTSISALRNNIVNPSAPL
jgi:hypothetical protein